MGVQVSPVKLGPDYIDPAFHSVACGKPSVNIDPWAMPPSLQTALLPSGLCVAEAMMGLFDGAADGSGSAADFACAHGVPVLLVVDCASMGHSVAAIAHGFATHRPGVEVTGIILNRVGSDRHEAMLRDALATLALPVVAAMRRDEKLTLPSRHLGLVQAQEATNLDGFLDYAADQLAKTLNFEALAEMIADANLEAEVRQPATPMTPLPPPGQRIAIARDEAFAFFYPHFAQTWQAAGASLHFFSPLADEPPPQGCDVVLLPGGYPELHASRLSASKTFHVALRKIAQHTPIYGECGGYMVLGQGLVDAHGERHAMSGLLPVETSFEARKLHLGYRQGMVAAHSPVWPGLTFRGHEFHYSQQLSAASGQAFVTGVSDATGREIGALGATAGLVTGSYLHLICEAANG